MCGEGGAGGRVRWACEMLGEIGASGRECGISSGGAWTDRIEVLEAVRTGGAETQPACYKTGATQHVPATTSLLRA